MTIVGIDPGLANLGWGCIHVTETELQHVAHGVIKTHSSDVLAVRLLAIDEKFASIIERYRPDVVSLERQFFVKNVTNGLLVAHVLGLLLIQCARQRIECVEYTPRIIKQTITGQSTSSKKTVESFVAIQLGIEGISIDHCSDALGAAISHYRHLHNIHLRPKPGEKPAKEPEKKPGEKPEKKPATSPSFVKKKKVAL